MRRIEQYTRELPHEKACVIISKRDYRLMRAVVKEVENVWERWPKQRHVDMVAMGAALGRFNKPVKS